MNADAPSSFGWRPDPPDFRDLTPQVASVAATLKRLSGAGPRRRSRGKPTAVDLREFFPPAFDQGPLPASPASACVALLEYFERRALGRQSSLSRLFVHYNAGQLGMAEGDSSVDLRATLQAIACCGAPPERYWSYDLARAKDPPPAFLYSLARQPEGFQYVRLDGRNLEGGMALEMVCSFLAAGFPAVFGLSMPSSVSRAAEIPYRPTFDSIIGGQALVAVGYDDRWLSSSRGALLVRNSWGSDWGDRGHGWLPYAFVEQRLAVDFWTVLRPDWIASGELACPSVIRSGSRQAR